MATESCDSVDTRVTRPGQGPERHLIVVHSIPGRLPVRLHNKPAAAQIAKRLGTRPGVRQCQASVTTGSLLATYHSGETTASALIEFVASVLGKISGEPDETMAETVVEMLPRSLGAAIKRRVTEFNAEVAQWTGGHADMRIILALGAIGWGVREIIRGRGPALSWPWAFWFAYILFRDYSIPVEAALPERRRSARAGRVSRKPTSR